MKTLLDLQSDYRAGKYNARRPEGTILPENYIFDEDLSVRENRDMVTKHNASVRAERDICKKRQAELDSKLYYDSVDVVKDMISSNFNGIFIPDSVLEEVSKVVVSRIREDHHSNMYDYFASFNDEVEYAVKVIKKFVV